MLHETAGAGPGPEGVGLALVLGAGGIRGIAHTGVLEALLQGGVRPQAVIGTSSGALVAAAWAVAGWGADRLVARAMQMRPLAILEPILQRPIPEEIRALLSNRGGGWLGPILDAIGDRTFDDLHHGVRRLGINCVDLLTRREIFFVTGGAGPLPPVRDAVLGSAALPILCPSRPVRLDGAAARLVDGGVARTICVEEAFAPPVSARRVLVVDLHVMTGFNERRLDRFPRLRRMWGDRLRVIEPAVDSFGTVMMGRSAPARLIEAGRRAVDAATLKWAREAAAPVDAPRSLF